jgi:hypothetical protein
MKYSIKYTIIALIVIDFIILSFFPIQVVFRNFFHQKREKNEIENYLKPLIAELSQNILFNIKHEGITLSRKILINRKGDHLGKIIKLPMNCIYIPNNFTNYNGLTEVLKNNGFAPYFLIDNNKDSTYIINYDVDKIFFIDGIKEFKNVVLPIYFRLEENNIISNVFLSCKRFDKNQFYHMAIKNFNP